MNNWGLDNPKKESNKKRVEFQLDKVFDADIIDKLKQQFNVGQYIRDLIRKDIQK